MLREACPAPVSSLASHGDEGALLIQTESARVDCDKRRGALVEIIDGSNPKAAKPWWKIGR